MQRRWSWPGSGKRSVSGPKGGISRPDNGIYDFTNPKDNKKHKDKWLFTMVLHRRCLEGDCRGRRSVHHADGARPDVAPYHDRQNVILDRAGCLGMLPVSRRGDTALERFFDPA